MSLSVHESVLLEEIMNNFKLKPKMTFLDATLGGGGVSAAVAQKLSGDLTLVAMDKDREAITRSADKLSSLRIKKLHLLEADFRSLDEAYRGTGERSPDAILFDLGLSSDQLELSGRGFSFKRAEPLLMNFSQNPETPQKTAWWLVNYLPEEELARIFREYGEEPRAASYARAIILKRKAKKIETSVELAEIIGRAAPKSHSLKHPATLVFQALRMAVNDELGALKEALPKALSILASGGRLAIISFHSGEDRIVKNFFKDSEKAGRGKILTKKPIGPKRAEIIKNPRARSAKLRVFEKK